MPIRYLSELTAAYAECPAAYVEVRTLTPQGKATARFFALDKMMDADEYIRLRRNHENVYIGVLPRSTAPTTGSGGRDADVNLAATVWTDIDAKGSCTGDVTAFLRSIRQRLPKPRMTVASGSGGVHLYWTLKEPVRLDDESRKAFARTLRRLVHFVGEGPAGLIADRSCTNVSRLLRVPGTFNFKHDPPVRAVATISDDADILTWDDWRRLLPFEPQPERTLKPLQQGATPFAAVTVASKLRSWAQQGYPEGSRHSGLTGAAAFLRRDTDLSENDARALFDLKVSMSAGREPLMQSEVEDIWTWAGQ